MPGVDPTDVLGARIHRYATVAFGFRRGSAVGYSPALQTPGGTRAAWCLMTAVAGPRRRRQTSGAENRECARWSAAPASSRGVTQALDLDLLDLVTGPV